MANDTDDLSGDPGEAVEPDPSLTRELFLQWRNPRLGRSNPENQTNPAWTWLFRSRLSAFQANGQFQGPCAVDAGPGWCANRFGQSATELPDGRVIFIAGEHEDFYDPDFFIYNDVIVRHPEGRIEIFGYPREVFPATDFHSATLARDRLILIGNLGYPENRNPDQTQVLVLDLASFAITPVSTSGENPGWIHLHAATLSPGENFLLIQGGKRDRLGAGGSLTENIDDWQLDIRNWTWTRLTKRAWPCREFTRADRKPNHLWEIQMAAWYRSVAWEQDFRSQMEKLEEELGIRPDLDLIPKLFRPSIAHETVPGTEEEHNVFRCRIDGVVVRYVVEFHFVRMTVEGSLPPDCLMALTEDLKNKLSQLEGAAFIATRI